MMNGNQSKENFLNLTVLDDEDSNDGCNALSDNECSDDDGYVHPKELEQMLTESRKSTIQKRVAESANAGTRSRADTQYTPMPAFQRFNDKPATRIPAATVTPPSTKKEKKKRCTLS